MHDLDIFCFFFERSAIYSHCMASAILFILEIQIITYLHMHACTND